MLQKFENLIKAMLYRRLWSKIEKISNRSDSDSNYNEFGQNTEPSESYSQTLQLLGKLTSYEVRRQIDTT